MDLYATDIYTEFPYPRWKVYIYLVCLNLFLAWCWIFGSLHFNLPDWEDAVLIRHLQLWLAYRSNRDFL